ncbi:conjugal transfer protein [Muricauda ruestringensis]|jgi:conjugal transfer/entry exclusion protein|uniref:Conjugal transfer protein n=1 Tax=Flagellimonas aurea TaxID=2915619 RepID=A0ABS3G8X5_9FLAO|nr:MULTISPECIES: conjugal transfer protein [Allomuricauda]MAO17949.1 conjugal transfer protein [Allomuricauda sp.]MBC71529.1 conjugal transfer protein [Allomuricauda sp.]MBO0355865.1 conjugal transfer protein [Allomuricauda aurea]|tara:strand:- start:121 stop:726 length:606 start_codon:yes stop_codon:yes gene_type:complete
MKIDWKQTLWNNPRLWILALILAISLSGRATAQGMPVYDNTNFISMTKSLLESAKQTSELLKTVEFLKEQKDNIVKVNNTIKQLKALRELARNNEILFRTVQNDLRDILNSPYIKAGEVEQVSKAFEQIMDTAIDDLDFVYQILSSDFLKMTDAERTAILMEKKVQSQEMVAELEVKTRRYREIISFRRMQDIINNRETEY